jgi:hypothetical protein
VSSRPERPRFSGSHLSRVGLKPLVGMTLLE